MKLKMMVVYVATLFFSTSCIHEPLVDSEGNFGDGTATRITLAIRGDQFSGDKEEQPTPEALRTPWAGPTRAAKADESLISQLHLLVFNAQGDTVATKKFTNLTATDGTYKLQAETLPGEGMQFYVIANADIDNLFSPKLSAELPKIKKLNELQALLATLQEGNNGLSRTARLLMVGNGTVTVNKPHATPILLTLHYLSAKVTVKITDDTPEGQEVEIEGWDMVNIPQKSYLLMREASDAVTGTTPADYLTTHAKQAFENKTSATADKPATWSHSFYLLENRRGGRVDKTPVSPGDGYPGMSLNDNDQRGKAWYAPAGATYLLVYGKYRENGRVNNVVYKIYLGADAVQDYNLVRGKHYQFNVAIKGVTKIDVDTTVDWGTASFTVEKSSNLLMDAHPDVRVVRIAATAVSAEQPAYAAVEVTNEEGTGQIDWLAVSPLNLYRHAVKQGSGTTQALGEGEGVGSFVRTKYTPAPTATSLFGEATFDMTRKLTGIPFTQPTVTTYQEVLVYADENAGTGERTGKILITYYTDAAGTQVAGSQSFLIRQSAALTLTPAVVPPATTRTTPIMSLAMERYEEAAMTLHPALADRLQHTAMMQWGYGDAELYSAADRFSNGSYLTANAVYTNVGTRNGMDAPQWSVTQYEQYRPKYPYTGGAISEGSSLSTSGTPYYYPELTEATLSSAFYHPIYNSSAARYCLEKNRDTNGDGVIDGDEVVWYLPSYADMMVIKNDANLSKALSGTYWTSTEEDAGKSWAFTFPKGTAQAVDKATLNRVRCVRGKGSPMAEPTFESGEKDKTKITLTADAKALGIFKIKDDKNYGIEWTVTATSDDTAWLKITKDSIGTDAATTWTAKGDSTLYAYATEANPSKEETRTATLTFTRKVMGGTETKKITVIQEFSAAIIGAKSNSYLLPPGKEISIPVERANESPIVLANISPEEDGTYHQIGEKTKWKASLVWEFPKGLVGLRSATGIGPEGRFIVTATDASVQGNAVVAIKNDQDEILWSWHIWVTTYDGSEVFAHNNGKYTYTFMDRLLGATSNEPGNLGINGLLYQWGRKDPFPGLGQEGGGWADDTTLKWSSDFIRVYNSLGELYKVTTVRISTDVTPNNLTNAIRNPDTFYADSGLPHHDWFVVKSSDLRNNNLWGGEVANLATPALKTVFDPCPDGWRVPPTLQKTSPFKNHPVVTLNKSQHGYTFSGTGFLPFTAARDGYKGGWEGGLNRYECWEAGWGINQQCNGSTLRIDKLNIYAPSGKGRSSGRVVRCCKETITPVL